MIRCAEIERLMDLINVQAVTINKIASHRNISIEADNFLQEVPSFFDYVRLNTIVNVLNQHAVCLKKLDTENVFDDEFFTPMTIIGKVSIFNGISARELIWMVVKNHGQSINLLLP